VVVLKLAGWKWGPATPCHRNQDFNEMVNDNGFNSDDNRPNKPDSNKYFKDDQ
jgi:hypothetical protein